MHCPATATDCAEIRCWGDGCLLAAGGWDALAPALLPDDSNVVAPAPPPPDDETGRRPPARRYRHTNKHIPPPGQRSFF